MRFAGSLLMLGLLRAGTQAAELPPGCKLTPSMVQVLRDHPSARVYDAVGAWFAQQNDGRCALASFAEAVRLEPQSAEAHYDLAVALAGNDKLAEAADEFRSALRLKPDIQGGRAALGAVLLDGGHPAEAEKELREALRVEPHSVPVLDHLAQSLAAQRRFDAAIRYWQQALAQQPDSPEIGLALGTATYEDATAKQALGIASAHEDGVKEAIRILSDLIHSHPDMKGAHFTLANIFAHEGRFREAADEYASVARLDPNDEQALLEEAKALITASAYVEALAPAQDYVRRRPESGEGHLLLGSVYKGQGEYAKAEAELRLAVAAQPEDFQSQYQLGFVLARNGKPDDALLHLQKAVTIHPDDSSAQFQLAAVLRAKGDDTLSAQATEEFKKSKERDFKVSQLAAKGNQANQSLQAGDPAHAAELYREMLAIDPNNARTEYNLALALEAANDVTGARAALTQAVKLDPKMALAFSELGSLALAAGDLAIAQTNLETAIGLDPQLVPALGNLGVLYGRQGDVARAQAVLQRAVDDDPRYAQGHLNLGLILAQEQHFKEADLELGKALDLTPDDLRTLSAAGKVKCRLRNSKDGLPLLERVVTLAPSSAAAHLDLAIALADSYDLPRALRESDAAVRLAPAASAVHFNRGLVLFDLGRMAECRPEFEKASELGPELPDPHYYLGLLSKQAGDFAAAIPHLEIVVRAEPRNAMAWHLLGQCYDAASKHAEAVNAWRQALAADPDYTQSIWSLAHAVQSSDPGESAQLLQRFASLQKKNNILDRASTLNNDAVALMNQSDWPGAISKLKEAIQLCSNCAASVDLHKNLGLVYCHAGNVEQGEKELRLAEASKPDDPQVEQALATIAQVRSKQQVR